MTVLRDVMFLPEPVPSLLGASGGSAVARHAASVVAARPLAEGVTSPPLTSEDVTALRCDASNFVSEQETPEKPLYVADLGGAAGWLRRLRLAPDCHTQSVTLRRHPARPRHFQLAAARAVPAGHQLSLWFSPLLAHELGVPFLTLRNIHGGGRYGCHRCGQLFQQPNPLKLHLALRCGAGRLSWPAAPPWPAACPAPAPPLQADQSRVCAEVESLVSSMGRSSKGHVCLYCGKLYSRKYGLKIHIRTHTGYKPLTCRVCARPFGDPSNLNKHVRLHADGDTPYRCDRCGKVLVRRRDLDRHMRSRHTPAAAAGTDSPLPAHSDTS